MSVEFCDSTGAIGQAATNTGYMDVMKQVEAFGGSEIKKLFKDGVTKVPKKASKEAIELAHKVKDNQVKSTLVNISKLLKDAKDFAVVETG